jgi:hypothetical protein
MEHAVDAKPRNSVLKKFREPTETDSETPQRANFAADCLRIPS